MVKGDTKKKTAVSKKSTAKKSLASEKKTTAVKKPVVKKKSNIKTTAVKKPVAKPIVKNASVPAVAPEVIKSVPAVAPEVIKSVPAVAPEVIKSVPLKKLDSVDSPVTKNYECCPEFNPSLWDEKEINWKKKFFVKDTVISLFHIPLNFGKVMGKNHKKIEAANAGTKNPLVVVDEINPFISHVYIDVTKPVMGCNDVKLTGNFLSKVFEGSYGNIRKWTREMNKYVKLKGKIIKRNYFFYPTCPKCSKKYKKNYVVILAEF